MATYTTEIAALNALLNSGATTTTVDGQTVTIDPASIRRRIRELQALDENIDVPARPVVNTLDLSGLG